MPEPIQAPPAPSGQPSPAPNSLEQAPNQQSPSTVSPPATPPAGTPPVPPADPNAPTPQQLAQLQQSQLEAQRKITEQGQELARLRQQRDALAGVSTPQPPADVLAPFVKMLVDDGYLEKDARNVVKMNHAMMQPVLQAQQQAAMAIQGSAMVDDVLRQAWTEMPAVFATNPQVGQRVQQTLRADALAGRPIDKDYAINLGLIEEGRARFMQTNGTPPPAPAAPVNFNSMWAPPPGYAPPAPPTTTKQPLTPEAQQWADDIQKTFKTNAR